MQPANDPSRRAHLALVDPHNAKQQLPAEAQRERRLRVQQRVDAVVDARAVDLLPFQTPIQVSRDPDETKWALLGEDLRRVKHRPWLLQRAVRARCRFPGARARWRC